MTSHYALGFIAGLLSLLAPCVLPIIPIVFGSSLRSHKLGPIVSALGLTFSFTIFGILTSLFSSVFDIDTIQKLGAIILVLVGIVFIFPRFKDYIISKLSIVSEAGNKLQGQVKGRGLLSEFLLGVTLGMIWGPCSGPTLAFAFGIASQADQVLHASLIFLFFGLGAGIGLVGVGLLLRKFSKLTGLLLKHTTKVNFVLGLLSIFIGILILSGQLSSFEAKILELMPDWLVRLSTRY